MRRATLQPQALDLPRLDALLGAVDRALPIGPRLESASRPLLGSPYLRHPLIGSADTPEVFTISLDGFDCVTLVETVLAAALAEQRSRFVDVVRQVRYADGVIDWRKRNHYMTGWLRRNAQRGVVHEVRPGHKAVARNRRLNVLAGLPAREIVLRCVPKRRLYRFRHEIETGDILVFASTKSNRDFFHLGLAVRQGEEVRLRHASRSRQKVLDQDLLEFLNMNRMSGVVVARPTGETP
jgi:hypothetical protein